MIRRRVIDSQAARLETPVEWTQLRQIQRRGGETMQAINYTIQLMKRRVIHLLQH